MVQKWLFWILKKEEALVLQISWDTYNFNLNPELPAFISYHCILRLYTQLDL